MTSLVDSHPIVHEPRSLNKERDDMNIFFRFVDGKNISLLVNQDTEIQTIKEMLIQKAAEQTQTSSTTTTAARGFQASQSSNALVASFLCLWYAVAAYYNTLKASDLFFVCNGKPLDEDGVVGDYNDLLQSGKSTVYVSARNNGGCFMISASVLAMICTAIVGSTCTCGFSLLAVPVLLPLLFVLPLFCL